MNKYKAGRDIATQYFLTKYNRNFRIYPKDILCLVISSLLIAKIIVMAIDAGLDYWL